MQWVTGSGRSARAGRWAFLAIAAPFPVAAVVFLVVIPEGDLLFCCHSAAKRRNLLLPSPPLPSHYPSTPVILRQPWRTRILFCCCSFRPDPEQAKRAEAEWRNLLFARLPQNALNFSQNLDRVSTLFTMNYKILFSKPQQNRLSSAKTTQLSVSKGHALGIFTPFHAV